MSLSIGIVGLPNVGKSTLFNALTRAKVDAQNYPFCTIDPNVGCVEVPDERLEKLAKISNSDKIVPTYIEFVDIAGLVSGAHKGEGLGNKFLSHIRETDAICHVLRYFENDDITHVEGRIDPKTDLELIQTELIMADLEVATNAYQNLSKRVKDPKIDKDTIKTYEILEKLIDHLNNEKMIKSFELDGEEVELLKGYGFLSQKPSIYAINVDEGALKMNISEVLEKAGLSLDLDSVILISAQIEAELSQLSPADAKEYLNELNIEYTGLENLIQAGYIVLDLISMITTGEIETKVWTVPRGTLAPQAAGKIHTDFEKGFIVADVISFEDFISSEGWVNARDKGLIRTEGKNYEIKEGDIVIFKHNT